jgi:hypothetical protein
MPIEIRDVDDGLGTFITGTGVIAGNDYLKAFHKQLTQPTEKRMKYLYSLSDFTGVTKMDLTMEAIKAFSEMCKSSSAVSYGNLIAVAVSKDIEDRLSQVWEMLRNETEWKIRVFWNIEEAKCWIKKCLKDKWHLTDLTFE